MTNIYDDFALQYFGKNFDQLDRKQRDMVKNMAWPSIYSMGPQKLSTEQPKVDLVGLDFSKIERRILALQKKPGI